MDKEDLLKLMEFGASYDKACSNEERDSIFTESELAFQKMITRETDLLKEQIKVFREGLHEINKYRKAKSQTIETIIETLTK